MITQPFPFSENDKAKPCISLRDYFAAKAMQGVLSNSQLVKDIQQTAKIKKLDDDDVIAKFSYGIANAMLKQRED